MLCLRLSVMASANQILVSVMLACTIQSVLADWRPFAQINNSRIIGQTVKFKGIPVDRFLGIPFGQPPWEELRFQKTKPIESYPEEFLANQWPPACQQYTTNNYEWFYLGSGRSENCLLLNIWVPSGANYWNQKNKKAVMLWIHGGNFRVGATRLKMYNARALAALGDIIVVTVQYRLENFGFFTTNTADAPGNAGIWDILESLKWVNKHIPAFGGDPSRITIAGWDAGAISVGLLSVSPLSKGLYARQIMQSGSPVYRRADNNTQNIMHSQQLAERMGCAKGNVTIYNSPKTVAECMKYKGGLYKKDYEMAKYKSYHLVPQFGDEILPDNPRLSVINNNFRCSDLLIGSNKDEGSYIVKGVAYKTLSDIFFGIIRNYTIARRELRKSVAYFPDPEAIVNYYLPPSYQNATGVDLARQVYTAVGDTVYTCPSVYYAEKCAEQKKNVFYYYFNHKARVRVVGNYRWMNGSHSFEMPYVFGTPISTNWFREDWLSLQVIAIWSSFVKYGNPSIEWQTYSKEKPIFKYIGPDSVTGETGKGPQTENCNFLRPHFGF